MQKVLYRGEAQEYAPYFEERVRSYIQEGQIETFEGFENYDLMAFDWYDVHSENTAVSQILIYIDREDLFFLCEDQRAFDRAASLLPAGQNNERALYLFFAGLLKNDMARLEEYETQITDAEADALDSLRKDYLRSIYGYRRETLRLKRYYEQLALILDNLCANDNGLFSRQGVRSLTIVANRVARFCASVVALRDYVTQMREACQSQMDLEQNNLMRFFTVITAIFLPLTLIAGWYGMNFRYMPELSWRYGYLGVVVLSAAVCVVLIVWFKRKKWF